MQDVIEYHIADVQNKDPNVQDNEEGVIILEEDHIASEEESSVENEGEIEVENGLDPPEDLNAEEVVVANIDGNEEPEGSIVQVRPIRANTGAGIGRL